MNPLSRNPWSAPDRQVQGLILSSEAYCRQLLGYLYLLLKGGGTLLFLVRYLWGSFADGINDCKTKESTQSNTLTENNKLEQEDMVFPDSQD